MTIWSLDIQLQLSFSFSTLFKMKKHTYIANTLKMTPSQEGTVFKSKMENKCVKSSVSLLETYNYVILQGKEIPPAKFSLLLGMLKVKDRRFCQIVKMLAKSCTVMHLNPPLLVEKYFQSEEFFQQFINLNNIIKELWMLRKEDPAQLQEYKMKHRQIFCLNRKLLKFLERKFSQDWVKNLQERVKRHNHLENEEMWSTILESYSNMMYFLNLRSTFIKHIILIIKSDTPSPILFSLCCLKRSFKYQINKKPKGKTLSNQVIYSCITNSWLSDLYLPMFMKMFIKYLQIGEFYGPKT